MKYRLLPFILIAASFFGTQALQAQERTEETVTKIDSTGESSTTYVRLTKTEDMRELKNMVMVNPIRFVAMFNASYYRALTPNVAVGGTLETPTAIIDDDLSGFGVQGDVLFYPGKKVFRGFHVGGNVSFHTLTYETYLENRGVYGEVTDNPFSLGAYMGWNWWWGSEINTEIAIGADYHVEPTTDQVISPWSDKKGAVPYFSFKIGYAW